MVIIFTPSYITYLKCDRVSSKLTHVCENCVYDVVKFISLKITWPIFFKKVDEVIQQKVGPCKNVLINAIIYPSTYYWNKKHFHVIKQKCFGNNLQDKVVEVVTLTWYLFAYVYFKHVWKMEQQARTSAVVVNIKVSQFWPEDLSLWFRNRKDNSSYTTYKATTRTLKSSSR